MPKTRDFAELEELELPAIEEHVKGYVLPELDEDGKCILKDIPDLDLEKKRTRSGYTLFMSLYGGSTGSQSDGYKPSFDKSGRILLAGKEGKFWMTYLDFLSLLGLVSENLEFVKYQIIRQRADIKEEIGRKSAFLS